MNDIRRENVLFIRKSNRLFAKLHKALVSNDRIEFWQRALKAHYHINEEVSYESKSSNART